MKTCKSGQHQYEGRICSECNKVRQREWRAANLEHVLAKKREFAARHKEKIRAKRNQDVIDLADWYIRFLLGGKEVSAEAIVAKRQELLAKRLELSKLGTEKVCSRGHTYTRGTCRQCWQFEYYTAHKADWLAKTKAYQLAHPEQVKKSKQAWAARNIEATRVRGRETQRRLWADPATHAHVAEISRRCAAKAREEVTLSYLRKLPGITKETAPEILSAKREHLLTKRLIQEIQNECKSSS